MLTPAHLLAGTPVVPPTPTPLKRGLLSVEFEDGLLRNIRLGNTLVLQRIYCAVRDHNWATIPGVVRIISDERTSTDIKIVFDCTHQQNDIDFVWTGTIRLTPSQVSFDMDGTAQSSFKRNRIGFCILHDADLAGQPCTIEHVDGIKTEGVFPKDIAPHQPYFNIRAIQHAVDADTTVTVRMEGDTFEMEDQRNWSDASYKTYCTALAQPIPMLIEAGTRIHQTVTLSIVGNATIADTEQKIVISRIPGETILPALGVVLADESVPAGPRQIEALRALDLRHLRVDLEPADKGFEAKVAYTQRMSRDLNAPLEVALWVNDVESDGLRLSDVLRQMPLTIVRWLVFNRADMSGVTSSAIIDQVRPALKAISDAPIYSGTDALFTQLNRARPNPDTMDGLTFSSNPQVHAFDNRTLIEALPIQGLQVTHARRFGNDKPVAVSALTLKFRWNPDVKTPVPVPEGELPPNVDPRQMSLLAAVWTLGSIKHNAQAEAHSLTYFTTHGLTGLIDADGGSPVPEKFPTVGGAYPVYWVMWSLARLQDARVLHTQSSHPRLVDALEIVDPKEHGIIIFNYTPDPQTVTFDQRPGTYTRRDLNLETAMRLITDPVPSHTPFSDPIHSTGDFTITLSPYSIVFLDKKTV